MQNLSSDEFRKCPFCSYVMTRPFPKICPNPICLKQIDDISKDTFLQNILDKNIQTQIRRLYEPTEPYIETEKPKDIKPIKVSTAKPADRIEGVRIKPPSSTVDFKSDVIVIPSFGQYFKNIGIVTEDRESIYDKNENYSYLQELSINLDYIASSIIGGEIDRLVLCSDYSQASEKVLYIKKTGLIYFLYGQFPDKQGYWILNNMRKELESSLKGRNIKNLSPIDWHELKRNFPKKIENILEQYAKTATDVMTERQIPSVVDTIRFDYFGMSYQSIGTISKILGNEFLKLNPEEDAGVAIDLKESEITAKIEAIAANTIANTSATPQYLTVKLGYQKMRYLLFEKLDNEYFIYMLAEGNLVQYESVLEQLKGLVKPYTEKPFRGDLKPFIELKKKITEFFQMRTF